MKYVSYTLSIIGVFLLLNIFLSYSSSSYKTFLNDTKNAIIGTKRIEELEKTKEKDIELNSKILNSLEKINENLENIKNQGKDSTYSTRIREDFENLSGSINSKNLQKSGSSSMISGYNNLSNLDIPGTLLAQLLPEINLVSIKNNGVFGVKDSKLQDLKYTTFYDDKKKIKLYIFDKKYHEVLDLFKRFTIFKINESNTFFSFSFFLNSIRKDSIIRFVTISETKAIGFEVEKINYDLLKKNLTD